MIMLLAGYYYARMVLDFWFVISVLTVKESKEMAGTGWQCACAKVAS
jgi:hypothetical protein